MARATTFAQACRGGLVALALAACSGEMNIDRSVLAGDASESREGTTGPTSETVGLPGTDGGNAAVIGGADGGLAVGIDGGAPEDASLGSDGDLKAPTLTMVMPMGTGLHVVWTNNQWDCDTIEGERKLASEAYRVAFAVRGRATNKHDGPVDQGVEYTYRLRCIKGAARSPYSNEMAGKR